MTQIENEKCERLCVDAILNIKQANKVYNSSYHTKTELKKADSWYNYAIGINQVLATLGYKSDSMIELTKLL